MFGWITRGSGALAALGNGNWKLGNGKRGLPQRTQRAQRGYVCFVFFVARRSRGLDWKLGNGKRETGFATSGLEDPVMTSLSVCSFFSNMARKRQSLPIFFQHHTRFSDFFQSSKFVVGCVDLQVYCWLVVSGSWLVVRGPWFVVRGSWLVVRGSWLVARGSWLAQSHNFRIPQFHNFRIPQ